MSTEATKAEAGGPRLLGLSRNVFFLGVVSFLTDVSSELTLTILPLFLTDVLRVGTAIVGLIEGVAESTATLMRLVSGWLSDLKGQRKPLAVIGYSLSTAAKPFLYLASTWGLVLVVRFADRVGKGIRTAPRDALLADSTSPEERGKSFGFHRSLDSLGAMVGLGIAAVVVFVLQSRELLLTRSTYQTLVLAGIVPAVLGVLVLLFLVRERRPRLQPRPAGTGSRGLDLSAFKSLDRRFKLFLLVAGLFTLGNSSDAFLILRAHNIGLSTLDILLVLVLFNAVYAAVSYPAGVLSDKLGRKLVILVGWAIYGMIYLGFALAGAAWQIVLLFVLYGVYYGATEGVLRALVADLVPERARGSAYGLYHSVVGISMLPASVIAGVLWQVVSPAAPFFFGAALALLAMVALAALIRK
ncbi:MAG: MFS transporter [Chloroflexi bacterium]|nr:MFS transporter [Chloroflexota bacterium]